MGERGKLAGLNIVGMKRRGFSKEEMHALRNAYQELFADGGTLRERLDRVAEAYAGNAAVEQVVAFLREDSQRGLVLPR
jgi:UDP-N-acetylglucosamine acyltransferase